MEKVANKILQQNAQDVENAHHIIGKNAQLRKGDEELYPTPDTI